MGVELTGALDREPLPIAIESAPASIPAKPAIRTAWPPCEAPATPMEMLRFETRPSLAPSTGRAELVAAAAPVPAFDARDRPARGASTGCQLAEEAGVGPLVARHAPQRLRLFVVHRLVRGLALGDRRHHELGPKWRAMNIRTRDRQAGLIRLVSTPAASSCLRQTPAWISSTSTMRCRSPGASRSALSLPGASKGLRHRSRPEGSRDSGRCRPS